MKTSERYPLVFDIARGSVVDGPGMRTVVFLKGCPLRCVWCQNPESQSLKPEFAIDSQYRRKGGSASKTDLIGHYYSPHELAKIILRDKIFYETSGGGVTFSGGESLIFVNYLHHVLKLLKTHNIHVAVETCGYFNFHAFQEKLSPYLDLLLYDIKVMDCQKHEKFTGKPNDRIIYNFKKLRTIRFNILPRIPLIPHYTATKANLSQIAAFFTQNKIDCYCFLPYNPSGINKLKQLGKLVPGNISEKPMTLSEERRWIQFFNTKMYTA